MNRLKGQTPKDLCDRVPDHFCLFFWVRLCLFFGGRFCLFFCCGFCLFSLFGSNSLEREVPWEDPQFQARYTGCGGRFTPFRLYDSDLGFFPYWGFVLGLLLSNWVYSF